jgi:hypothetical protein
VKYELGFSIPEDTFLHSHRRENLKSYISSVYFNLYLKFEFLHQQLCHHLLRYGAIYIYVYRHFGGTYHLHLQERKLTEQKSIVQPPAWRWFVTDFRPWEWRWYASPKRRLHRAQSCIPEDGNIDFTSTYVGAIHHESTEYEVEFDGWPLSGETHCASVGVIMRLIACPFSPSSHRRNVRGRTRHCN